MAGLNFDASQVPAQQAFENLTPGWYTARIVESQNKPTKSQTGSYLEIELEIIAPQQFAGRKLWDRLNLDNQNQKAVEIAQQTLSAICHAVGVLQIRDSSQLHGIPMDIKVGMSKVSDDYPEPRNEIKGYRPAQGGMGGGMPQQAAAPQMNGGWNQPQQQMQQPQMQQAQMQQPQMQQQQWQQPQQQQQQQPQMQQQPEQQPWQQPQQQQQWQQQPQEQQMQQQQPAEQMQQVQNPPMGGNQQQQPWQTQAPEQSGAPAQQQVQQQQQQQVQQEYQPHPQTDPNAQQAAQGNLPPWQQN